jgi:hypothetical protein
MDAEEFLQFLRPETLKVCLRDIAESKEDDPGWTTARDILMDFVTYSGLLDEEDKMRFLRHVPGP